MYYTLTLLLGDDIAHASNPEDDNQLEEQEEAHREESDAQMQDAPQLLDRAETPGSQDTGYATNPDREYLEQGAAAMMNYPPRDLPDDQLQRYRADLRDMREDMAHEMHDELRQEVDERIDELDNEAARRGITSEQQNNTSEQRNNISEQQYNTNNNNNSISNNNSSNISNNNNN